MGDLLLSTSRLNRILEIGTDAVRVEAGVTLLDLDAALARAGKYYPPSPTFTGAKNTTTTPMSRKLPRQSSLASDPMGTSWLRGQSSR